MRPSGLLLLAAISLSLLVAAGASTRPHYGGTLRVAIQEAPTSLDPSDSSQPATSAWHSLSGLIFETLVTLDARGQTQPALSISWHAEPGNQRWQFSLRRAVTFHDGTAMGPDAVAASLRTANPNWKVFATPEGVVIECDVPTANLPAQLALPRYGIAKRSGAKLTGSGPFSISRWDQGKRLVLIARDDYWGGRTFVDSVEIEMGKSFREQMIALDLGKADIVEVAPDQARHATLEGRRIETSAPAEWMALVFNHEIQSAEEGGLRQALALGIDREAMNSVLLQGGSEPTGAFLPNWLSGYAFLFPASPDLQRARQNRDEIRTTAAWTLGYESSDPLARVIAERIALNAHDAGLTLQASSASSKAVSNDIRLIRIPLPSLDARLALSELAATLGLPPFRIEGNGSDDGDLAGKLYTAENALLQSQRVIPLLHLRTAVALNPRVMGWRGIPDGSWPLQNLWLETGKP